MTRQYPRVLVVTGNNFNLVSGGGITLTNLFQGWPSECLANVHQDPTPEDRSVCTNFYRLSSREIRWIWPFSLGQSWYEGNKLRRASEEYSPRAIPAHSGEPGWLRWGTAVLGEGVPKYVRLSEPLVRWVQQFQPTLLYGFLGSLEQMDLISQLAKLKSIPMVVHMMDDWPAVTYRQGILGPLVRPFVRRQLNRVFRQAALRMGICDEMCKAYNRRYGCEFLSFQNALDVERWIPFRRTQWKANVPFIVRYVGSIVANAQQESLLDVCRAVQELTSAGEQIEMWVHTPQPDARYLRAAGFPSGPVRLEGPPSHEHIAHLLSMSDLLVLPYNFDERSVRYIKLSMPTKAPAYMISAVPVLVYAPSVVATAKYAAHGGWGRVVSIQGVRHLREEIYRLMKDEKARRQYGERAHQLACERHNASVIRPAFWKRLMEAAPVSDHRALTG